jgi:hypothetical protein
MNQNIVLVAYNCEYVTNCDFIIIIIRPLLLLLAVVKHINKRIIITIINRRTIQRTLRQETLQSTNIKFYKIMAVSMLTYASENWIINRPDKKRK